MAPFANEAAFDPERSDQFFAALPSRPAVVLLEPRTELTGARSLLLRTADLRRRMRLLLSPPEPDSRRLNLREYAARVRYQITGSVFEQQFVYLQHASALWPGNYRERLRLRVPTFVKLNLANAYPRAQITRRIGSSGIHFGPFPTRKAAEVFLEPFLDLFRIRRCQIKIRRDPDFPGCIYSEMNMCLAPCFGGCTPEDYAAEAGRVAEFLYARGASLREELAHEREKASAELDFEKASALHRRFEKADAVCRLLPEIARPLENLNAVVLQRAAQESTVAVFVIRSGRIAEPASLEFREAADRPRSVEQILRDLLEPPSNASDQPSPESSQAPTAAPPIAKASINALEDHLALLSRWFYGRPREGEIFMQEPKPIGWPYRRILRACSRLLSSAPAAPAS